MDELLNLLYTQNSQPKNMQRYLHHGFLAQRLMAGSEPIIQEADPHITKLAVRALMKDEMVLIKKSSPSPGFEIKSLDLQANMQPIEPSLLRGLVVSKCNVPKLNYSKKIV